MRSVVIFEGYSLDNAGAERIDQCTNELVKGHINGRKHNAQKGR